MFSFPTVKFCISVLMCRSISAAEVFSLSVADSVFSFKALVYIPLSYEEHRHIYLVEGCISVTWTENKPRPEKKQASSPLPISSLHGFVPLHFSGWLEHLFLLLPKLFVCLNNYAPMFLILFLKSPQSHYTVSGPSRFWIFQKLNTTVCWKQVYARSCTVGWPLTLSVTSWSNTLS